MTDYRRFDTLGNDTDDEGAEEIDRARDRFDRAKAQVCPSLQSSTAPSPVCLPPTPSTDRPLLLAP